MNRSAAGAQALLCAAAVAVCDVQYEWFFGSPAYRPGLLGAAVLAAALALAVDRFHPLTRAASAVVGCLGCALGAAAAVDGWDSPESVATAVGSGLVRGWARILTVGPPADVTGELLLPPLLISFTATFLSVGALRSRSVLLPAGPPVVAFVAALVVTAGRPGNRLGATAALLLLISGLAALRAGAGRAAPAGRRRFRPAAAVRRRAAGMLAGVVVAAVAGTAALPLADADDRADPRPLRPRQIVIGDTVTPLAGVGRLLAQRPAQTLFTVRLSKAGRITPTPDRIRLVTLADFDGLVWTSADRFLVAGGTLRPTDVVGPHVTARIELAGLTGSYLPAVGVPVRVRGGWLHGHLGFNAAAGVVVTDRLPARGSYEVTGVLPGRSDRLGSATSSTRAVWAALTTLPPGLPAAVAARSAELARVGPTRYGRLLAVERFLRSLPYRADASPGQSYAAVARLVAGHRPADRAGYAEQHAAAFVVLARALGVPARIVVGFRLRNGTAGRYRVTTADAHAWAEAHVDGRGWIEFEPTDPARVAPTEPPAPGIPPPPTPTSRPHQPALPPPVGATATPMVVRPPAGGTTDTSDPLTGHWPLLVGSGTVMLLAMTAPVVAKAFRRRRRHRRGGPRERVIGAWYEATDRLLESGVGSPAACTPADLATRVGTVSRPAGRTMTQLAARVDAALYAPAPPGPADVDAAWALTRRLTGGLYGRRLSVRRTRGWLDPRPLRYSHSTHRHARRASRRLGGRR